MYAIQQEASLSQILSSHEERLASHEERLRNARTALRELKKQDDLNSSDEEQARSSIEFWKDRCDKAKATIKLHEANAVDIGAAVLPGQPAKASATKPRKPVFEVNASNNSSPSSETNSSDSSSYGSMANEKENLGKICRKRGQKKEVILISSESSSDEQK